MNKKLHFNVIKSFTLLLIFSFLLESCSSSRPFKLILLPDTQTYTLRFPEIFKSQTQWIAGHPKSVAYVLHLGDITGNNGDDQWAVAETSMRILDGKVPVAVVPGNHDIGTRGRSDVRNTELYNQYFPYSRYSKMKTFGGAYEEGKMDNTWHEFKAGGYKWLILSLEFGPRNSVLDWAADVIRNHPKHKIILQTHAYMYSDNTRMSDARSHKWLPKNYGLGKGQGPDAVNDGEQIWQKLLSRFPNVILAFSGHVLNEGTGRLVSEGIQGNLVYQMLSNYQNGVIGTVNGGNGFLRIVTVDTRGKKISIQSYSPYINEYKTDSSQQFEYRDVDFKTPRGVN